MSSDTPKQIPAVTASKEMPHEQQHKAHRTGWIRAAVLGANDGIVSTASLIVGVAAAQSTQANIVLAGTAGLVAGAISMASGEYVSVKSQQDTEKADLKIESDSLEKNWAAEQDELAQIYRKRGLEKDLADEVARQLMKHDALAAHARDDIGLTEELSARPLQAAATSAGTFAAGAIIPLLMAMISPMEMILWFVPLLAFVLLGLLGGLAALAGGASAWRGALRVCIWGSVAMGLTAAVGSLFELFMPGGG